MFHETNCSASGQTRTRVECVCIKIMYMYVHVDETIQVFKQKKKIHAWHLNTHTSQTTCVHQNAW